MYCTNCGEKISEGSAYCVNCGNAVKALPNIGSYPQPAAANKNTTVTVVSALLGILLSVFLIVLAALIVARPGNIADIVAGADVTILLEDMGVVDEIIDGFEISNQYRINVDEDSLRDFLRRDRVKTEVGYVLQGYVTAIADGNLSYGLTSRDVVRVVRNLAPDIRDEFNYRLTDDDYNAITEILETEVNLRDYRVGNLLDDAGIGERFPWLLLSVYPVLFAAILCAIPVFNIFMLRRSYVRSAFFVTGITFAVTGFICAVAGLLFGPLSGIFRNSAGAIYGIVRALAGVSNMVMIYGLIVLLIGALLITAFILIKKFRGTVNPVEAVGKRARAWRIANLVTNLSLAMACIVVALVCYLQMP